MSTHERELGMKIFVNLSDEDFADLTSYAKTHYKVGQIAKNKKSYDPNARYLDTACPEARKQIDEFYENGGLEKQKKALDDLFKGLAEIPEGEEDIPDNILKLCKGNSSKGYDKSLFNNWEDNE
jgi:hypothetical protein